MKQTLLAHLSSIYLAFNATLVALFSTILYGLEINRIVLLTAFLTTYSIYTMNKATDVVEDLINRGYAGNLVSFLVPSIITTYLAASMASMIGIQAVMLIAGLFIIAGIYSIRISKKLPRLKDIAGVKSLIVALSWGLTGALLPAFNHTVYVDPVFLYIFLQILVNTIICDIRDVEGDMLSGVRTIPIALGLESTKRLLLVINSCIVICVLLNMMRGLYLQYTPALFFGAIYGYILIWRFARRKTNPWMVELAVDGEWIPITLLMFTMR